MLRSLSVSMCGAVRPHLVRARVVSVIVSLDLVIVPVFEFAVFLRGIVVRAVRLSFLGHVAPDYPGSEFEFEPA